MTTKKSNTEYCNLEDLLFPVEIIDNPRKTNSEYSKVVVGVVDGEEIDLNYCSPRYELVPNASIFPIVEEIFNQNNIDFSVIYQQINNARFYAEYIIEDQRFAYRFEGTNDVIKFRFSFQHSYNGLTKYMGIAGFYRLVCSNGLIVPVAEMDEYNLKLQGKHTASIKESLVKFNDLLNHLIQNLGVVKESITEKYQLLTKVSRNNLDQRLRDVLKGSKIAIIENKKFNLIDHLTNIVVREQYQLGYANPNDWLIYNAINNYLYDNDFNIAAPEKRRDSDSKVMEWLLNDNQGILIGMS